MGKNFSVQQAVRYAILAAAAGGSPNAFPQTPPQTRPAAATMEEIVVTGTRIKALNAVSFSAVASVSASDIAATGMTRVEDVLNNLPMVFAGQGSTVSNGSDGTATVDLRNLGPQRTLILVNGRRLGPGSSDGRNYGDLNQIPAALVERIDILTGGASAVYGADAVAGVVNFVLDTKFEGVKVDGNYSSFGHHNSNSYAAALVTAAGYPLPAKNVNTGYSKDFSILIGSNFADDKGNATFYATYTDTAAVLQDKYDYSSCVINSPSKAGLALGRKAKCGGSGTSAGGYFQAYSATGTALFTKTVDRQTGAFRDFNAGTDLYNFGPLNYYQRPSTRYTAGTFINYDVNPNVNAYAEFMFSKNSSVAQIAPSGDFFNLDTISCANPLLTAEELAIICSPANLAAQATLANPTPAGISMYIGRRNIEGGGRQATFAADSYRTILGVRGDFGEAWNYDAYYQYGTTQNNFSQLNYLSNTKISKALNVVSGPNGPVCASGDPCVPWNIWVPRGVTAAATSYLSLPLLVEGSVSEQVFSGSISGDLGKYGMRLPSATSGLQASFGAEHRVEKANYNPDDASQQGIAAGSGGPTVPVAGSFSVSELFTEFRMPLIEGAPGAELLSTEGGYRYSDYNLGFTTSTYKFGLQWKPVKDVLVRASYNRAVRAPNVSELFLPQSVQLDGTSDPCAGTAPAFTAAQCAFSGVTATQYGKITANPAAQYNGLLGGNPNLKPETADTYSYGLVIEPRAVPNLLISLDYFDIKIKDTIGPIGGDVIAANCVTSGNPVFCNAVIRSNTGSLWKSVTGYVSDLNVNFGSVSTKGIDFKANYRLPIQSLGALTFRLEATKLNNLSTQPLNNGPSYDCVGFYGAKCGVPSPSWRHTLNTTWSTPWHGLDVGVRWRYYGSVKSERTSSDPQLKNAFYPATASIGAYSYFDLSAAMDLSHGLTLRVGANNLADKDPPISVSGALSDCPTGTCNGNTYAQVYDTLGRFMYAHVSVKF